MVKGKLLRCEAKKSYVICSVPAARIRPCGVYKIVVAVQLYHVPRVADAVRLAGYISAFDAEPVQQQLGSF